jgi:zinc transporter ZupT
VKGIAVALASGIFIGAVLFDIAPDASRDIGILATLILLVVGFITWIFLRLLVSRYSDKSFAVVASLALWCHSFFEGALTALSFSLNFRLGVIVSIGVLLHLLPEFFAVVAALQQGGLSTKRAIQIDMITIGVLAISFTLFHLVLPGTSTYSIDLPAVVIGGAFIYLGLILAYRSVRSLKTFSGLASGMALAFIWGLFVLKVFHL